MDNRPNLQEYARQLETELGLPKGIADTLVRTESGGNPYAISPKGAIGLTQLMPDTAKELGVNPHDPYDNLKGGLTYFAKQYNKFNQNPVLAAAAYNAGPNAIGLKSRDTTKLPQETQNYMSKFTGYLNQTPVKTGLSQEEAIALGLEEAPKPKQLSKEEAINLGLEQPSVAKSLSQEEAIALGLEQPRTLGGALEESVGNILPSIGENVLNTAKAIWNTPETATGIKDIIAGEALKLAPKSTLEKSLKYAQMQPTGDPIKDKAIEQAKEVVNAYNTATEFNKNLVNRYGGKQEILNTLATDPAGLLLDVAPVGTGIVKGASAGAKAIGKMVGESSPGMTGFIKEKIPGSVNVGGGTTSKATFTLEPDVTEQLKTASGNKKAAEYVTNVEKVLQPIQRAFETGSNAPSEITSAAFNKVIAPLTKTAISKWSRMSPEDISAAYNSGRISGEALPVPMSDVSSPFYKIAPQIDFTNNPVKSAIVAGEALTGNIPAAIASVAAASPRTVGVTAKTLGGLYSIPEEINRFKKNIQPYRGTLNAVERLNEQLQQNPELLNNIPNLPLSPTDKLAGLIDTAMGKTQYSGLESPDIFGYAPTQTAQHNVAADLSMYALGLNKPSGRPGLFTPKEPIKPKEPVVIPSETPTPKKPVKTEKGLLTPKVEPKPIEPVEPVNIDNGFNPEDYFNSLLKAEETNQKVELPVKSVKSFDFNMQDLTPEEQLFANLSTKTPSNVENTDIMSGLLSRKSGLFGDVQSKVKQIENTLPIAPEDPAAYDRWMKSHENRSAGQQIRRQIDKDVKQYTYVTSNKNKKSVDLGLLSDLEKQYNTSFDYSTLPNIKNMGLKEARKTIKKWTVDQIKSTGGVKSGLLKGND